MNPNIVHQSTIYHQLDSSARQIRLLKLTEGLQDGRVEGQLSQTSLTDATFVVLSYRWGLEDATHEITLNGQIFYVRPNLWEFLNVARKQQGTLLWIDALCINQSDARERSQQVRIMGEIFRSASLVVSWLGPAHETTSAIGHAFDLMSHVWESSLNEINTAPVLSEQVQKYDNLPLPDSSLSEDDLWQCVAYLCSLKYWDRAWVVQEILLSGNNCLLYGDKLLQWQMFANFLTLVDVRFKCPLQHSRTILNSTARSYALSKPYKNLPHNAESLLRNDFKGLNTGRAWDVDEFGLFRILTMFGRRECTVPLDHVYALLSLTSEGRQFPISYGINVDELFALVFYHCAEVHALQQQSNPSDGIYYPKSQRAFLQNARYLAEVMGLCFSHEQTPPCFPGIGARAPHPKADPYWPRPHQRLVLDCSIVEAGNLPPTLRSSRLQQKLSEFDYDVLLHIDESSSWLLCRKRLSTELLIIATVLTIKDNAQGRGFKFLDAGPLSTCVLSAKEVNLCEQKWQLVVEPSMHLTLLTAAILGEQPG